MISQREVFPYFKKCVSYLEEQYEYIQSLYDNDCIDELFKIRGYVGDEQMSLLRGMNIGCCEIDDVSLLGDFAKEFGIVSDKDYFILNRRYNIPIYDISGNLVSIVGYYNDRRKYVTIPSPFFSKECMFFNFRQAYDLSWGSYNGFVVLVEGIFDCLSLRSVGLPCIATMGSNVSSIKGELLKLFRKVLAIPDDDTTGRRALNRYDKKYGWKVPCNTTFMKFDGGYHDFDGVMLHCKDMDDFVSWFDAEDVRETLLSYYDCKEDIVELKL